MRPADRRDPLRLWLAQYVTATGDALFMPCLGWLAAGVGGGGLPLGFAVFVATAPHLLFGPLAGTLADRWDRRRLMIVCDLARAGLLLALPLFVLLWGSLPFAVLLLVALLLAAFSAPFLAARDALLPELVEAERLPRWNAWIQTSSTFAMIQGLALGGLLLVALERWGVGRDEEGRVLALVGIDGLTFLVSALVLWRIRYRAPAVVRDADAPSAFADLREGLGMARKDPVVRGLLVLTALNNLAIMGPAIVGAVLLVKDDFEGSASEFAFFEGAMAVGMLLGALLVARHAKPAHMGRWLFFGMIADGLTYIPFFWVPGYKPALALIVAHGIFIPCIVVARTSLVQQHVAPRHRGRVFALVNLTVLGVTSISALLCGALASTVGARGLFLGAGILGAVSGLVGIPWMGARLRDVGRRASA